MADERHPAARDLERMAFEPPERHGGTAAATHVEGCGACRARIDGLLEARRRFLAERPVGRFLAEVEARGASRGRGADRRRAVGLVLGAGAVLAAAGDVLRFVVSADRDGHLLIVNVDAEGRITRYHPADAPRAAPLRAGARQILPGSGELDGFVGEEAIVALLSPAPLEEAEVAAALGRSFRRHGGRLAALDAPELEAHVAIVRIVKR